MWLDPPNGHTVDAAGLQTCGYAAICGAPFNESLCEGLSKSFSFDLRLQHTEGRWTWMHGTTSASHRDNKMQSIILCISVNCKVAQESSIVTFHCVLLTSVFLIYPALK
jgi:hypothetical protein